MPHVRSMASSKTANAQPAATRARRAPASPAHKLVEEFAVEGRRYRWREGEGITAPAALRKPGRRASLPGLFTRTVVPQLERRGARGLIFAAAPAPGIATNDVRWVAWRAPGDPAPVWGLYLAARRLD